MRMGAERFLWERRIALGCGVALALIWLGAVLLACGPDFEWKSPLGIHMFPGQLADYFTPEQVDAHAEHMVDGLIEQGLDEQLLRQAVSVEWVDVRPSAFPCPTMQEPSRRCMGLQWGRSLWVAATPCVWQTALSHEMAHQLLEYVTGDPDTNHQRSGVWALTVPLEECPTPQGSPALWRDALSE